MYSDSNGNHIIDASEVEEGVGVLNWDNEYDTDICQYLDDCDEEELSLIERSREWNREYLLQEFFDNNFETKIDWAKFNGNFSDLIYEYFNSEISIEEFYESEDVIINES